MKRILELIILGVLLWVVFLRARCLESLPTAESGVDEPAIQADHETPPPIPSRRPKGTLVEGFAVYKYVCYLPAGYATQTNRWPLIVFLHGACADDRTDKLRHFGPIKYALDHEDFQFVALAPATAQGWSVAGLSVFLTMAQKWFPKVDAQRVYVTGYSMGGHATWALATAFPNRFAAIAPVAGAGNPQEVSMRLRHIPTWVFHGAKDNVVPAAYGQAMIRAMENAGAEIKATIYPDRGHDIWAQPYQNPELYEWFLQHSLAGN